MVCVYCGSKTSVTNSRATGLGATTWRRRYCRSCKAISTSVERYDISQTHRVKYANGTLAPLQRDRLFIDVYQSLEHRKTALADASALSDTILAMSMDVSHKAVIDVEQIVRIAITTLEKFDHAGAVYYKARHPAT